MFALSCLTYTHRIDTDTARVAEGWRRVNSRFGEQLRALEPRDFALKAHDEYFPIWAIVSHTAGTRIYWLCGILGQPGANSTPFDGSGEGWEDHLDVPRSKDEVLSAMDSTWLVVEQWLAGWSSERLTATVRRKRADGKTQLQDHHSVLVRLLSHESYHAGEVALILGMHGIEAMDLWQRLDAEPALKAKQA